MDDLNQRRIAHYGTVSTHLTCLSNQQLKKLLTNAQPKHEGIGGKSAFITVDDIPVFVKKIPLTELEHLPQHFMSTANLFDLPLFYQYGVGSAGFGAWRELATHIITTNWVITGECANFPMLYHFRILPSGEADHNRNYWGNLKKYLHYWENSPQIAQRVEAINKSSFHIALFLEYIPENLQTWLSKQIQKSDKEVSSAIDFVTQHLHATNTFMNAQGLMHFDAHFDNILTDGKLLYLSDFGLALSTKFDLSEAESAFLKHHQTYDQACASVNLLHCLMTSFFGNEEWEMRLRENITETCQKVPLAVANVIQRDTPLALLMDSFFCKLQKESKSTPYPAKDVEALLKVSQTDHY